jgi:Flp pilus assembly CpaF family ATPase
VQEINFIQKLIDPRIISALSDSDVTDIIVNSSGKLIINSKSKGKQILGKADQGDIKHAMQAFCQYRGLYLNETNPSQTVHLPNEAPYFGARMKCLIEPCTPAPAMVIRRHSEDVYPLDDFVEKTIMQPEEAAFLRDCIGKYRTIAFVGMPGSGKTALTASMINEIGKITPKDRVLILEATPEIHVDIEDVEYMKTNPLSMQELVANTTQMAGNRIIVGEVIDSSAHDMMKANILGCSGGMSTFHSKSAKHAPLRLVELSCEKGIEPPISLVNASMDVIVHMSKDPKHPWGMRVVEIAELKGYNYDTKEFIVETVNLKPNGEKK